MNGLVRTIWTYRGCTIFRNTEPGYALRYTTRCLGRQFAADTLAGIRELIQDELNLYTRRKS